MSQKGWSGALVLCVAGSALAAPGDAYRRVKLDCSKKEIRADVTVVEMIQEGYQAPYALVNIEECDLPNFGSLRIKWGRGPIYAHGQGHGIPTGFLSLWVNQAKVLSGREFDCETEPCPLRVTVTGEGLRTCQPGAADSVAFDQCEFKRWDELRRARDALEFPMAGEKKRPPDFSPAIAYAQDEAFCRHFAHPSGSQRVGVPEGAKGPDKIRTGPFEYNGSYEFYDLDVDNDGREDHVVHLHSSTHAFTGDAIHVFSTKPVPEVPVVKVGDTRSQERYEAAADSVLPRDWKLKPARIDAPWWDPADLIGNPLSFGSFDPIRFNGRTYFVASDASWWGVLLEPMPGGTVQLKCAVHRVQPNY